MLETKKRTAFCNLEWVLLQMKPTTEHWHIKQHWIDLPNGLSVNPTLVMIIEQL